MFDLRIVEAEGPPHTDDVASLLRDYLLWLHRQFAVAEGAIDEAIDQHEWDSELADLPGHYGAPHGAMLLAHVDNVPAGCALMRGIGENVCEVKRLFVRPAFHHHGIARGLVERSSSIASSLGYSRIRAQAGRRQIAPQSVFRALGFRQVAPSSKASPWFKENMLSFEAATRDVVARSTGWNDILPALGVSECA